MSARSKPAAPGPPPNSTRNSARRCRKKPPRSCSAPGEMNRRVIICGNRAAPWIFRPTLAAEAISAVRCLAALPTATTALHGSTIRYVAERTRKSTKRARPSGVGREFRYRVDLIHGAEIFLNSFGIVIVTLRLLRDDFPKDTTTPWGELLDFVYHLSHVKYRVPMNWRIEENGASESAVPQPTQVDTLPAGVANGGAASDTSKNTACWTRASMRKRGPPTP